MIRWLAGLLLVVLSGSAGCGSDGGTGVRDGGGAGCPDLSGAWQITEHSCQPGTVGQTLTITQAGCTLTAIDPWTGWTGAVDNAGQVVVTGDAGGTSMTCTGVVVGTSITMGCTPTCAVKIVRVSR
jgi:hypothetical protein